MTYSCTDFTDSILDALKIELDDDERDSPSAQADKALAEIERLQRAANAHDLAALLWRAAAAMETPDDLTETDRAALLSDLIDAARAIDPREGV